MKQHVHFYKWAIATVLIENNAAEMIKWCEGCEGVEWTTMDDFSKTSKPLYKRIIGAYLKDEDAVAFKLKFGL